MANLTQPAADDRPRIEMPSRPPPARAVPMCAGVARASRSVSPCWPCRGRGAARLPACAARASCSGAIARRPPTSCCWRRPTCAPTMPALPTRSPPAASGSPARSPICAAARRSRFRPRALPGHASCTASAGCAISTERRPARTGAIARQARRRMDQGQPRRAGARLGAGGRGPPRPLLAVACGPAARWRGAQALRRRHAQPDRSDHVSLHLLARCARRLSAARRPDRPRPRPSVHRRPRWPPGAIAEAPGGGAGAPDPARRRPHQPQSVGSRGAAARPAAAAPMLRRARQDAGRRAARDHPADDGDAASPSPRRRHAGALQRHGSGRARRACHRACLRRRPAGRPRRAGALRVRAAGARRHGRARRRRAAAADGACGRRLRGLPLLRAELGQRAGARQRRAFRARSRRAGASLPAPRRTTTRSVSASSPRPSSCAMPAWNGRSAPRRCVIPTT